MSLALAFVVGLASWFTTHPGHAAAGPLLRQGHWRGSHVLVCALPVTPFSVRCTGLLVVDDFCGCEKGRSDERAVDLPPAEFRKLAPLGQGLARVLILS